MTQVNNFDGGIALRIDPSLIKINEAQNLVNVDTNPLVLKSILGATETDVQAKEYFKFFDFNWVFSSNDRDYIEYENILYYTQANGSPGMYKDSETEDMLGIVKPTSSILTEVIESSEDTVPVQYTETLYSSIYDIESAPAPYTDEVEISSASFLVRLSGFNTNTDKKITHRRIYRLGGNLTKMTLIAELSIDDSTFTDNIADIDATEILKTESNYPPEVGMHSLIESYSIFFGITGNKVKFSAIDEPNSWPPENSFKLRENGTGLLAIPQGILVFTRHDTYLLTGTSVTEFSLIKISSNQGCLSHKSCQVVKNSPLWVSNDGICTLQNGYVQVLSKPLLGKQELNIAQSVVYDEQYFLLFHNSTLFTLDMRSGFRFYYLDFNMPVKGIGVSGNKMYLQADSKLYTAFTGEPLTLEYTSPVFIENNHATAKMYNNVYIRANGSFSVDMFIDNERVLTKIIDGNETFNLTPPTEKQRGYSCYFKIIGIGTIYTIDTQPVIANVN